MTMVAPAMGICFVAPNAYPALSGEGRFGEIGGAQVQQSVIARELARRGHRVSFVVNDYGQPDATCIDGITCYRMCRLDAGIPGLRFFHPRWSSLWSAMSRADAAVYYQRGAGYETGQVALFARLKRRPFVFAAASDSNCDAQITDLHTRRDRLLFKYGLRGASLVVAQTDHQADLFRTHHARNARVIRSATDFPCLPQLPQLADRLANGPRVLWVGRWSTKKRFEWLIEVAARCPGITFEVVGDQPDKNAYAQALADRVRQHANIQVRGCLPRADMVHVYDRAALLLCTSVTEGYPNVFLEAWSRGLPVVSTVDPDGVVTRRDLGRVAGGVDTLVEAVTQLLANSTDWERCAAHALVFVRDHHALNTVVNQYEACFRELVITSCCRA